MNDAIESLAGQLGRIIVGKQEPIRLAIACLLARGHLLIEDVPGVGKTTLAQAIARSLGLDFRRIQFTSDLLPADVVGNSIFDRERQRFIFHQGPLFSQLVLIDEINRATPKTQSALLEAMEERQVSADGVTHVLPQPFIVVATQNPLYQIGTFPLPESQLDRFLMRLHLGYPDRPAEREMLLGGDRRQLARQLSPAMNVEQWKEMQEAATRVHTSAALLDYVQDLLEASRQRHRTGLSPRAGLALLSASRAWAFMAGRDAVLPEDVQAVAVAIMAHRLGGTAVGSGEGRVLAADILQSVRVD